MFPHRNYLWYIFAIPRKYSLHRGFIIEQNAMVISLVGMVKYVNAYCVGPGKSSVPRWHNLRVKQFLKVKKNISCKYSFII